MLVYNAARLRDGGKPFLTEAAMCKFFSSEVAERAASMAVNLYGGYGFVKDYYARFCSDLGANPRI